MKNNKRLNQKLFNLNKQLELEQKRNKSRWYALNSVILNTEFLVEKLKKKNNKYKNTTGTWLNLNHPNKIYKNKKKELKTKRIKIIKF